MTQIMVYGTPMIIVECTDPWYNKAHYLKRPPPWAKSRGGTAMMSDPQLKVVDAFSMINTDANDKGLNRWQRRRVVATSMRGKSFGGTPRIPKRSPATDAQVKAAISSANAIVARVT